MNARSSGYLHLDKRRRQEECKQGTFTKPQEII
jgi:hypothetical protein